MQDSIFRENLFSFPSKAFKTHIVKEGNNCILFSGKFGIGKTFFLDHFFKDEIQLKEFDEVRYNTFHIYPVNYSIASNEDIFRYIKYDLITLMLEKDIKVEDQDLKYLDAIPFYIKSHPLKVLATLAYFIPKVGKDIFDSYKKLEELKDELEKHNKENFQSEGTQLINFMEGIEIDEGSVYENNIITKLIHNILKRLKGDNKEESNTNKAIENVLIIDDLDRIDPEHVFRLLNVFAAHLDNPNGLPNKLGFDKVILVCDVNNIRNIFKAKYGSHSDFNGYIDKFYSYEIFYLDNRKILKEISFETFRSVNLKDLSHQSKSVIIQELRNENLARELLEIFIHAGIVNLRTLLNKTKKRLEVDLYEEIRFAQGAITNKNDYFTLLHFRILKEIMGGYDEIKEAINKLPNQALVFNEMDNYCKEFIYFISAHIHKFKDEANVGDFELNGKFLDFNISEHKHNNNTVSIYSVRGKTSNSMFTKADFIYLLNDFLDVLKRIGN